MPRKSAWKVSQKCNETSPENERKPAPRLKGRNGRTFLFRFRFAHQDGPHSYISRSVCKGKPFCAVKIKVEALPHLVFHKASFAAYLYQANNDGEWGEMRFDFATGTAEIVRLAEWDTIKSNVFARTAIRYIQSLPEVRLLKEAVVMFDQAL